MIPQESSQPVLGTYNILTAIAAKVPTYCMQKYCMGSGAIGGYFADFSDQGVDAGEIAARVLAGEKPEDHSGFQRRRSAPRTSTGGS